MKFGAVWKQFERNSEHLELCWGHLGCFVWSLEPLGGHVWALRGHLDGTWEPLKGPLGALWAQFGIDFEEIVAQIGVKSCAVTTKSGFCESAESFALVE